MSNAKLTAARDALALVASHSVVGLGSGSTATLFIRSLGEALRDGPLAGVVGIPTSDESERLARGVGIAVGDFAAHAACDLTIDGADEVDAGLNLIKGLGGALLREKLVAQNSRRLVIIVDDSKYVPRLGTKGPLPVEVTPFGLAAHERFLRSLGATPTLRAAAVGGGPFVTDNGNHIFDCRFDGGIADAAALAAALAARAGIVEHGLFLGMAERVIVATAEGAIETLLRSSPPREA